MPGIERGRGLPSSRTSSSRRLDVAVVLHDVQEFGGAMIRALDGSAQQCFVADPTSPVVSRTIGWKYVRTGPAAAPRNLISIRARRRRFSAVNRRTFRKRLRPDFLARYIAASHRAVIGRQVAGTLTATPTLTEGSTTAPSELQRRHHHREHAGRSSPRSPTRMSSSRIANSSPEGAPRCRAGARVFAGGARPLEARCRPRDGRGCR